MLRSITRLVPRVAASNVMTMPLAAVQARYNPFLQSVTYPSFQLHNFSTKNQIWVRGLPYSTTEEELREAFAEYGDIEELELPKRSDGKPSGQCVIKFTSPEEAKSALELDESSFGSRWIRVALLEHDLKITRGTAGQILHPTKVYIGNLSFNTTTDELANMFEHCGEIAHINLVVDIQTQKSRGYGFVEFSSSSSIPSALKLSGKYLDGRAVTISQAKLPAEQKEKVKQQGKKSSQTVFVANLPTDIEEETLHSMFEHCGTINYIRIATHKETGFPLGFAHIEFTLPESASNALALKGSELDGNIIHVDLALEKAKKSSKN